MELRILGPLEVIDDNGEPLLLPGPKQRSLLARACAPRERGRVV